LLDFEKIAPTVRAKRSWATRKCCGAHQLEMRECVKVVRQGSDMSTTTTWAARRRTRGLGVSKPNAVTCTTHAMIKRSPTSPCVRHWQDDEVVITDFLHAHASCGGKGRARTQLPVRGTGSAGVAARWRLGRCGCGCHWRFGRRAQELRTEARGGCMRGCLLEVGRLMAR
jgi:hypothetical protein